MSSLAQCLTHLPAKNVRKIAAGLFPGHAASWGRAADITALIVEKLLDEDFLADFIKRLDDQNLSIISMFIWGAGQHGITKNKAKALLTAARGDGSLEDLASLIARGLVFETSFGGDWGSYFVPEDLAERLSLALARNFLPEAVPPGKDVAENIFTGSFYEDCLTFLAYAHKNPLVLTQKGTIQKRTVGRILQLMHFKESPNIPDTVYYPFRFWLLFKYALFINALVQSGQVLMVQTDAVAQWFKQKPLNRILQASSLVWNLSLKACPNPMINALMKLILQMRGNCWYGYAALAGAARKMVAPAICAGPQPEDFLEMMLGAGLLVEGVSREGERMVRLGFWSPRNKVAQFPALPGEEDGFWVQPNFEVLAPPWLKPALRWQLEMVADPVKVDQSFTYALTRQAALGFFDRGGHVPDMIGFLEKFSKNPLPQNVLFTIKEWGALYGRVSFWDVFLLRCDDEQLVDEISAHPKLKPYIHGRFDQNHLIVSRHQYDSLLAALQKEGYFPRKNIFKASR